jgi:hypothetical protein
MPNIGVEDISSRHISTVVFAEIFDLANSSHALAINSVLTSIPASSEDDLVRTDKSSDSFARVFRISLEHLHPICKL